MRAALIGCGRIGSKIADDPKASGIQSHAEAYVKTSGIELVGVCDTNIETARECAQRWGVKSFFADPKQLLESCSPEIVSVCTPDDTHSSILNQLWQFQSVRGVLAEKPLAVTSGEAQGIGLNFDKSGKILAVNYTRRFTSIFQNIQNAIVNRQIGKIKTITGHYVKGIKHNGTHWIDLVRFLGEEIASVVGSNPLSDVSADPAIDVNFETISGTRISLFAHDCQDFTIFEMDIFGTEGRIQILDGGERIKLYEKCESPFATGYTYLLEADKSFHGGMRDAALFAVQNLISAVKNNRTPKCSWRDGVKAIEIAECAINSSSQGGSKISVSR